MKRPLNEVRSDLNQLDEKILLVSRAFWIWELWTRDYESVRLLFYRLENESLGLLSIGLAKIFIWLVSTLFN